MIQALPKNDKVLRATHPVCLRIQHEKTTNGRTKNPGQ